MVASKLTQFISIASLVVLQLACSGERYTQLMNTSKDGNTKAMIRAMDEYDAKIDQRTSEGKTALMLAASNGHAAAVQLLIDRGADISIQDRFGTTAIIISATAGKNEVVKLLLKQNADTTTKDSSGGSAFDNANFYGHTETIKLLLSGTNTLPKKLGGELLLIASGLGYADIVKAYLEFGVDPNSVGVKNRTPLITAAAFDKPEIIQILLAQNANTQLKDINGKTALDIAKLEDNKEIIKLLQ